MKALLKKTLVSGEGHKRIERILFWWCQSVCVHWITHNAMGLGPVELSFGRLCLGVTCSSNPICETYTFDYSKYGKIQN